MKRTIRFAGIFLSVALLTTFLLCGTSSAEEKVIDVSHAADGYFTVCDPVNANVRMKIGVTMDGQTTYYDYTPGTAASYAFAKGDGTYTLTLYRNISGTKYRKVTSTQVEVQLSNALMPYLVSTVEITFSESDSVGVTAAELCGGLKSDSEKAVAIHNFIAASFTYDHDFASQVNSGAVRSYTPQTGAILADGNGICYDFAALYAAMCRSQGIPCAIARGSLDGRSHAWNLVWLNEKWVALDLTRSIAYRTDAVSVSECAITNVPGYMLTGC